MMMITMMMKIIIIVYGGQGYDLGVEPMLSIFKTS
jgi:hypothetical protein